MTGIELILALWLLALTVVAAAGAARIGALEGKKRKPRKVKASNGLGNPGSHTPEAF